MIATTTTCKARPGIYQQPFCKGFRCKFLTDLERRVKRRLGYTILHQLDAAKEASPSYISNKIEFFQIIEAIEKLRFSLPASHQ